MKSSDAKTIANAIGSSNSICEFQKSIGAGTLPPMTEIDQETRREKLAREISKADSVAAFARDYRVDATYMRQLLSKHRPFGEKAARKLEIAMGKPEGWLSAPEGEESIIEIAAIMRTLTPELRAQLVGYAKGIAAHPRPAETAVDKSRSKPTALPEATPATPLERTKKKQAIFDQSQEITANATGLIGKIQKSHRKPVSEKPLVKVAEKKKK